MSEHDEQVALISWVRLHEGRYPDLKLLYAIPNGGARNLIVAMKLKREGVKSGVLDLHLPVPVGEFHGLWVEMKYGKGKLTEAQQDFKEEMDRRGFATAVCWNWIDAAQVIADYLGFPFRGDVIAPVGRMI